MKKVLLVALVVLGFAPSASASLTQRCVTSDQFDPTAFACSKTFIATKKPQTFQALGHDLRDYASRWVAENGRQFVTLAKVRPWCRMFGRYGNIRVRENDCDGNLVVTVRSIGPPTPVTFDWEVLR